MHKYQFVGNTFQFSVVCRISVVESEIYKEMLRTVSDIHVILHYFPCNINSFKWKSGKIGMKKEGEVENV